MTARGAAAAVLVAFYGACLVFGPAGALPGHAALQPPSIAHPLGTDDLGRDMLAAILQAGRGSLLVAAVATVLALLLGLAAGLAAGIGPPLLDQALMRLAEIVSSLPALLAAVLVAALFGGSGWHLALVLGFTRWPMVARILRAETQALLAREFLRAAWALGATPWQVARRHLLPCLAAPLLAGAGIVFGGAVLAEAALAFVGLGDPEAGSWGRMIAQGFAMLGLGWWLWLWPVATLVVVSGLVAVAAGDGSAA
ncbi:ABC transporter permease [Roseomonas sp. CECT 9278]|uniref:ABC transporter permease n=1 Tax=Roseomonas sp. CECT 9278 TaxID=2845823 RepID=UPI001E4C7D3E|nr:ABC transporter permease subunit [Roseomonas sp. CECT 9278]CAH0200120.1 putative D,D-dipeptide transport system permease protein DdpC [Roseomonas sp. CECT 9278]